MKPEIQQDFQHLFRVPKGALVDLLWSLQASEIPSAATKAGITVSCKTRDDLTSLSHSDLIRIYQRLPGMTADTVRQLYEEYRYQGMKSLYLYSSDNLGTLTLTEANLEDLNQLIQPIKTAYGLPSTYSKLKIRSIDLLHLQAGALVELSYSYVAVVQVIDPETEYPKLVDDLRSGFVWLNQGERWLVVCAKDEVIAEALVQAISQCVSAVSVERLPFPKTLLQQVEHSEHLRRATLHDPKTKTTRRITNPNLANDNDAWLEVLARDEHDERPSSGYNQLLPGGIIFALGYSSTKGRIYFQRELTVSQMREWAPVKINDIVGTYRRLLDESPPELLESAAAEVLKRMPLDKRAVFVEIAGAIIFCKKERVSEAPLKTGITTILSALGSLVEVRLRHYCEYCDDIVDLYCPHCDHVPTFDTGGQLSCEKCAASVSVSELRCSDGHDMNLTVLDDILELIPMDRCIKDVRNVINEASSVGFNVDEEFFSLRRGNLFYAGAEERVVLNIEELPELDSLISARISDPDVAVAIQALGHFKEKCKKINTKNCAGCVAKRVGPKCYLRLFGLLDSTFTPTPHQGDEFGDYRRSVTLPNLGTKQMIIMMKSSKLNPKEIRLRQKEGQDIYTQFASYLRNSTVDVIGVCVPRTLESYLKAMMKQEAAFHKKKIVFLDEVTLGRIVASVLRMHSIGLDDL